MTYFLVFVEFLFTILLWLLVIYLLLKYSYSYKITVNGLQILLFNLIPIYKIPYLNIEGLEETTVKSYFLSLWKMSGIPFAPISRFRGDAVKLKLKGKIFSTILITPADKETFMDEISFHVLETSHE